MRLLPKLLLGILGTAILICSVGLTYMWFGWVRMPGTSFAGNLPVVAEPSARASRLEKHVRILAEEIGERNAFHGRELSLAADYIEAQLGQIGYSVDRFTYATTISTEIKLEVDAFLSRRGAAPTDVNAHDEIEVYNLVAERPGKMPGFVVIAAHYDSVVISPGADDNATGVAALLELAEYFIDVEPAYGIRFVAFPIHDPPFWDSEYMGAYQYARQMSEKGEEVHAMLSLDGIGYFSDEEGSQNYPPPVSFFYPSKANFLAFASNLDNRALVQRMVRTFRDSKVPLATIGATMPPAIAGTDLSDHSSFWKFEYPGVVVTDTTFLRNSNYHDTTDTPDTLNYEALALAVDGLTDVIADLAGVDTNSAD